MPLVGWTVPGIGNVPFDYFERDNSSENGKPTVAPWHAAYAKHCYDSDLRHKGIGLTATGVAACQRQIFLQAMLPYYSNPNKTYPMTRGTAMHAHSGKWWPANYVTEESHDRRYRDKLTLEGTVFGVKQSGLVDAFRLERAPKDGEDPLSIRIVEILDSKFPNDTSSWRKTLQAKPEYAIQLNQARILLGQQQWALDAGYDQDDVVLTVWDHSFTQGKPPLAQTVPHMTEEEMGLYKPWNGDYTVYDIVDINTAINEEYNALGAAQRKDPVALAQLAARIPMLGDSMFQVKPGTTDKGRKRSARRGVMCSNCEVKEICYDLCAQYGTPQLLEEIPDA